MRRLSATFPALAATTLFGVPAIAHHSQAMFDASQEILIEGTVARFDWVNPHMYLIVATEGPDGEPALVEGEGLGITQALVDGLNREALQPGAPVVMRANPNRGGWGKQVRILDVTTQDGEIHPFEAVGVFVQGEAVLPELWRPAAIRDPVHRRKARSSHRVLCGSTREPQAPRTSPGR